MIQPRLKLFSFSYVTIRRETDKNDSCLFGLHCPLGRKKMQESRYTFDQVKDIIRQILREKPDAGMHEIHVEAPRDIPYKRLAIALYEVASNKSFSSSA
jgi:hypothetical protein